MFGVICQMSKSQTNAETVHTATTDYYAVKLVNVFASVEMRVK